MTEPLFTPEVIADLELVARYNLNSLHEGLKVHTTADPSFRQAVRRLHEKGIVTQADGGYLTDLGIELAEHVQAVLTILTGK
jgi:uncharacterized protein (TIGR02647 family)